MVWILKRYKIKVFELIEISLKHQNHESSSHVAKLYMDKSVAHFIVKTGTKTFGRDILITGDLKIDTGTSLNGIDISEEVVTLSGNHSLTGEHLHASIQIYIFIKVVTFFIFDKVVTLETTP